MLVSKQPLILPFLCHLSATTCQINSFDVSNSKLKPGLCSGAKTEINESTAPPQQQHKWGTLCIQNNCNNTTQFMA